MSEKEFSFKLSNTFPFESFKSNDENFKNTEQIDYDKSTQLQKQYFEIVQIQDIDLNETNIELVENLLFSTEDLLDNFITDTHDSKIGDEYFYKLLLVF